MCVLFLRDFHLPGCFAHARGVLCLRLVLLCVRDVSVCFVVVLRVSVVCVRVELWASPHYDCFVCCVVPRVYVYVRALCVCVGMSVVAMGL